MARDEVVIGVKVEGDGSGKKTLGDLRAEAAKLKKDLEGAELGSKGFNELAEKVKLADQELKGVTDSLKGVEKPAVGIKTELRNLKEEMASMDQGTQEFAEMAQQAAMLEDQIKDVDAQVRFLSSDTKNLDTLVQAGMGIAGSFQAAQGAMALFWHRE